MNRFTRMGARIAAAVLTSATLLACAWGSAGAATPYPMGAGNYLENFNDITNWTNGFASGVGAQYWGAVGIAGGGVGIPNGTTTTFSTTSFSTGGGGGVQKGTGNIALLTTGTSDNSSSLAIDLFLDFTGTTAGTLTFDWAEVTNSTGDRKGSLRVYTSTDGTTFTELAAAAVLNLTNNVASNGTVSAVQLPASFNNSSTARIRFYEYNGTGGTAGSRPKISIDNVAVTSSAGSLPPNPPTATAATNLSSNSFTANWNSSLSATSYQLDVATDAGFSSFVPGYNSLSVAGTSQSVTGLTSGMQYFYQVRAVNSNGASGNSNTITATTPSGLAAEPTVPANNVSWNSISSTSLTTVWTNGNGSNRLVVYKQGSPVTGTPNDGASYTASTTFGGGSVLNAGEFVVANGSSNTVTVTGLTPGTTYYVAVFEFNGSGGTENYLTTNPATGSQATTVATYAWVGGVSGDWQVPANWQDQSTLGPRTTPGSNDVLEFNSGGSVTVTDIPTQSIGQLIVINSTTVALAATGTAIITITGGSGTDLQVDAGSQLNLSGTSATKILVATGATGSISGSMTFTNAGHQMDAADASAVTFNSGAVLTQGNGGLGTNIFTNSGTANAFIFAAGSTLDQIAGSQPFGLTQPASKVTFQTGSLFKEEMTGNPAFSGRTYANFELNNAAATWTATGSAALSIDNLTITAGSPIFALTGAVSIKGNITVAPGASLKFQPATPGGSLALSGTSPQAIANNGSSTLLCDVNEPVTFFNTSGFTLDGTMTLNAASTVNPSVTLLVNPDGTLQVGATLTNNGSVLMGGTFTINNGGFAAGNGFNYGPSSLLMFNTNSGTYGVNGDAYWPSALGPQAVYCAGASGITLNVPRTVSGSFRTQAPVLGGNNLTVTGTLEMDDGGSFTGSPTYGAGSILVYNDASNATPTAEWAAVGSAGGEQPVGIGQPPTITIHGGGTIQVPGTPHWIPGDLNLNSGGFKLTTGGPISIGGNFTVLAGAQYLPQAEALWAKHSNDQVFQAVGGLSLGELVVDKANGGSPLRFGSAVSITNTSGDALIMLHGDINLNGHDLSMSGGGGIQSDGAAHVIDSSSPATVHITAPTTVHPTNAGSLTFTGPVTVDLSSSFDPSGLTVGGQMQINPGGSVVNDPPLWAPSSQLTYRLGGVYVRGPELSATSGPGCPLNVLVTNNTTVKPATLPINFGVTGTLTIDPGSSLEMNAATYPGVVHALVLKGGLSLDGDLSMTGDWTNNGGTFTPNLHTVEFDNSPLPAGFFDPGSEPFDGLTIHGAGVNLGTDVIVQRTLTLTTGNILTGPFFVDLGPNATVSGGSDASHVNGNVKVTIPTGSGVLKRMPIGDASFYTPVSVLFTTVTTSGDVSASTSVPNAPPASGFPPAGSGIDQTRYINRNWTLTNGGVAFDNYTTSMQFANADFQGGADYHKFIMAKKDGSTWQTFQPVFRNPNSIEAVGMTSMSDFRVGEVNCTPITVTPTVTDVACYGASTGAVSIAVSGGTGPYTYLWSNSATTQNISGVPAGSYSVTVTDANGCTGSTNATVNQPASALSVGETHTPTCLGSPDGTITLTVSGGTAPYTYLWNDNDTNQNRTGLAAGTYTVTVKDANNCTVGTGATIDVRQYTITATAGAHGQMSPSGAVAVDCGSNKTFTFTPDAGYHVVNVRVDGVDQGPSPSYTFSNVTAAHTIQVRFTQTLHTIAASAGAHGQISPTGNVSVADGADQTFTITPDDCYDVATLTVDSNPVTPATTYTFTNVITDHTIAVTFVLRQYTITSTAGAHGTIDPTATVDCGTDKTFNITPDAHYHVATLTVDSNPVTPATSYTFTNVHAAHTIDATFAIDQNTITASAGANGSINPNGAVSVDYDGTQLFTMTADAGYHVADVQVDAASVGAVATYTFTHVIASHTISVTFAQNPPVPPITALSATQIKTGNPAGSTTGIQLGWPTLPAGSTVEVWRAGYGNYPEYDDAPNAGSAPPAPGSYPPGAPWGVSPVTSSGGVDSPGTRDFWYYVAYVTDQYGTRSPVSNMTGGNLDYHLGDVTDGTTAGAGDNQVNTADISVLGAHYGASGAAVAAVAFLDVGPTTDLSVDARPTTDDVIDFEDLVVMAVNYNVVAQPAGPARPAAVAAARDEVTLEAPDKVGDNMTFAVHLQLDGTGLLQAVSTRLTWDPAVVEPVNLVSGDLIDAEGGVVMSPKPGTVDAAMLGVRAQGLIGSGRLATYSFRSLAAGDPKFAIASVDGRDSRNHKVPVGSTEKVTAAVAPGRTMLAPAAPNPFRQSSTLAFSLARGGDVELAIYSVDGRRVRTLARGFMDVGEYRMTWDGRDDSGAPVAAGMFFARLSAPQGQFTKSLVYLR